MSRKGKKSKIDWGKWHETMMDSIRAFDFDEAIRVATSLGYRVNEDDTDIEVTAGYLLDFITHACDWLILRYEEKWDGESEVERDAYTKQAYLDETGVYLVALELSSSYPAPTLEVSLVPLKGNDAYFRIQVVSVGQMF